jgi:hypothetical protein
MFEEFDAVQCHDPSLATAPPKGKHPESAWALALRDCHCYAACAK